MQFRQMGYLVRRFWQRLKRDKRLPFSSLITAASLVSCTLPAGQTQNLSADSNAINEGWQVIASGLERRTYFPGGSNPFTSIIALRIDPTQFTFRAHYEPGVARDIAGWREVLPDAAVFINANFFDRENRVLGLLVSDGFSYGQVYNDRGGLVQVQNNTVRVRSTLLEPYLGEALEQAVQAFPMLVTNGVSSFTNTRGDRPSRRTVAGQDALGRIVLLATSSLTGITLTELSAYLPTTDLGLVNAVNLDGGGSTLMFLDGMGSDPLRIFSFDPVPAVLAVYPR